MEIGSIETRKHGLAHQVMALQQQLSTVQNGFKETYGEVDINIQRWYYNVPRRCRS